MSNQRMEIRSLPISMDSDNSDGKLTVSGLVNGAGSVSEILQNPSNGRKFRETIAPGVFSDAIANSKRIDFLSQHDKSLILSTTDNGSLGLKETSAGLEMSATISETTWGKDTFQLIKDGIIRGMSFGMRVLKDTWSVTDDNIPMRTINAIELFEVSAVRNPAYKSSDIEARDIDVVNDVDVPDLEERDSKLAEEIKDEIREEDVPADTTDESRDEEVASDDAGSEDREGEDMAADEEPRDDEATTDESEARDGEEEPPANDDSEDRSASEIEALKTELRALSTDINSKITSAVAEVRAVYDQKISDLNQRLNDKEVAEEKRELEVSKKTAEVRDFFMGR